jgi:hypothetical protein
MMKNKVRYIALILLVAFTGACRDEETYPIPDFDRSSIPVFLQKDSDTGFINFLDFDATIVSFDVDRRGAEGVERIDVLITFNNSETGESTTVPYSAVNTFPTPITLSFDELIGIFPTEVVTQDTLDLGDSFQVGGNTLLTDGRYLTGGYSPSVVANDPVILTYNVACASDLAGTYDFVKISGAGTATTLLNQTIVQRAPGYYEVPDISMEFFAATPVKYRFTDICGEFFPDAASVDFGTQVVVKLNAGTGVDPVTGVITFNVEYIAPSCCGLAGNKVTFTATPK